MAIDEKYDSKKLTQQINGFNMQITHEENWKKTILIKVKKKCMTDLKL